MSIMHWPSVAAFLLIVQLVLRLYAWRQKKPLPFTFATVLHPVFFAWVLWMAGLWG